MVKRFLGLLTVITGSGLTIAAAYFLVTRQFEGVEWVGMIFGSLLGIGFVRIGIRWLLNIIDVNVYGVDGNDPRILLAKSRAHSEMKRFRRYLQEGEHHCFVKFPLEVGAGDIEHVWAVVHSHDRGVFNVSLASDPLKDPELSTDRFTVAESNVEDWQVMISENEIRGGFSVRAIAEIMQADGYRISREHRKMLEAFVDVKSG